MNLNNKRLWLLAALLNLVIVALLGLLLRYTFVAPVAGVNYKYLLHAHSHVALLGWLYPVLFVALLLAYLPSHLHQKPTYAWQYWLSQGAVLGMLLSFPVQGYGVVSITFSTAHILFTYWFAYSFLKAAKAAKVGAGVHTFSFRFIKAALFFLVLSSLGPWSMGPIMATGNTGTELYYNTIYFYLHFLYNGWFTFAVLGLMFWLLEKYKISFNRKYSLLFFRGMFWACIPAYLLSVLWIKPAIVVYLLAGAAALVQVLALVGLYFIVRPHLRNINVLFTGWPKVLLTLATTAFVLKTVMQFATAFPYMADLAYQLRNFIIGYLHLVLIGFVSFFVLAFLAQRGWLNYKSKLSKWGICVFVTGFVCSEALLFLQGVFYWAGLGEIPGYYILLFAVSAFLPVGILLFFAAQLRSSETIKAASESNILVKKV